MKSVPLNAFPRTLGRRAGSRTLRASGRVPAVIYGRQNKPQSLEINLQDIRDVIHSAASENVLLDLAVQGDAKPKRLAIIQEIQHHVLSSQVLHIDLHEVAEDEKVTLTVPVNGSGEAAGVKTGGGTLEHVLFKLKVRALPKDLPETIVVDVSHLEIGQAIHIGDIKPPPGVEIIGDKDISVLSVAAPITEAQEAAVLEAATATVGEVEMIKEKKEEGAEEEAEPAEKEAALKPGEKPAALKPGEKAPALKPGEKAPALKPGEKAAAVKPGEKAAPVVEKAWEKKGEKRQEKRR
jgi:large subunit ribosomal protein L25